MMENLGLAETVTVQVIPYVGFWDYVLFFGLLLLGAASIYAVARKFLNKTKEDKNEDREKILADIRGIRDIVCGTSTSASTASNDKPAGSEQ